MALQQDPLFESN